MNLQEWKKFYSNNSSKIVNPHVDRLALNADQNVQVKYFNLYINSIDIDIKKLKVKILK
jgi:hypothetical protein